MEETLKRLGQHAGVLGSIVVNSEGSILRARISSYSYIDNVVTQYSTRDSTLCWRIKAIKGFKHSFISGIAVKTSMDPSQTVQYTALISGITKQV